MGDGFYRSKDPTNSIKVLKEQKGYTNNTKNTISRHINAKTQQIPLSTLIWGDYGMAPTDGRVAKPERRWGCRRRIPKNGWMYLIDQDIKWHVFSQGCAFLAWENFSVTFNWFIWKKWKNYYNGDYGDAKLFLVLWYSFCSRPISWHHLNSSPDHHCCRGNEMWDKVGYN